MALKQLMDRGILKNIISQNVDGLHRKSQVPPHQLHELHGNLNIRVCSKCQSKYPRGYTIRNG